MKVSNVVRTLAACGLMAGGLAVAQTNATLKGVVSDQMCGAKHMMAGNPAKCTRDCVKDGTPYALVVGSKVYTLKGHSTELFNLAGKSAVVTGKVSGTTVDVSSVKAGQ
ncbi:MAG: hypothetical protein ACYDC6_13280 [Acidobacteriaceae bacterium]